MGKVDRPVGGHTGPLATLWSDCTGAASYVGSVQDFKRLVAWQKAHALFLNVFRTVRHMPRFVPTTLKSQVYRAADSIPTNIVEGSLSPSLLGAVVVLFHGALGTDHSYTQYVLRAVLTASAAC